MKKLRLLIELDYDDEAVHGDDPDAINWFRDGVLMSPDVGCELVLHSNEIGDELGIVKVLEIVDTAASTALEGASQ